MFNNCKIICVDNSGVEDALTLGKEYVVDTLINLDIPMVQLKDDNGYIHDFYLDRFDFDLPK
jgi:hypothetical protein